MEGFVVALFTRWLFLIPIGAVTELQKPNHLTTEDTESTEFRNFKSTAWFSLCSPCSQWLTSCVLQNFRQVLKGVVA